MSRIEKALEKAVKLRDNKAAAGPADAPPPPRPALPREPRADAPAVAVDNPYLVTLTDPASPITEEYRKLKSMVVRLTKLGGFQNTIMVTSSLGWEGKSITALNFAITLAQEYDHTVLLIDADLRKPSLHTYLGVSSEVGLADCLLGEAALREALIKTGIGRLSLLPAGKRVSDPVELLSSARMKEFVADLKHRYADRYVIIDTPPVLAFAETHAISTFVDGVIFVVKEGTASVQQLGSALDLLKLSKLLGIVYNDAGELNLTSHYHAAHYYGGQPPAPAGALPRHRYV